MEKAKKPPIATDDMTPRQHLRHWVQMLAWGLDEGAPDVLCKNWWERVLDHGSSLFGETIYSVGADPTKPDRHPENDG